MIAAYKKYKSAGLACLPTSEEKTPAIPKGASWKGGWNNPDEYKSSHGIAIICGKSSGNLECIDFDNSFGDIAQVFEAFAGMECIRELIDKYNFPIQKTKRGGFHLLYRCDLIEGNQKLAERINEAGRPETLIETRGEGGYFCADPTPGYQIKYGDVFNPPIITAEDRMILISACKSFNEVVTPYKKPELEETDKPGDIYNRSTESIEDMKRALKDAGWTELNDNVWRRPGKDKGISATLGKAHPGIFYNFSANGHPFENDHGYTAFQVVGLLKYKGDFKGFAKELYEKQNPKINDSTKKETTIINDLPAKIFARVGCTYYKIINHQDRYGINRKEVIVWKKEEIIQDYKRPFLKSVPHYDKFVMRPDNINFEPTLNGCYNLYTEFQHTPAEGEWQWTQWLLEHVFGEQYELGLRYMQILYLHPDRQTVILALVSTKRETGKTTFLNWINMLFGDNMILITSNDFQSGFNGHYGRKNVICVEETLFEKRLVIEKLKSLATQKYITINDKFIIPYMIPFYGKLILTSNFEDRFALIDDKEIRFFVRKLEEPKHKDHTIENYLLKEIPAFLHYLKSLPPVDWRVSRSGFTPEELKNESLTAVVKESRHEISKDLEILIKEYFNTHENLEQFYASATDLKKQFFPYDNRNGIAWLTRALKEDFNYLPEEMRRYYEFEDETKTSKSGTPYLFKRIDFCQSVKDCQTPF